MAWSPLRPADRTNSLRRRRGRCRSGLRSGIGSARSASCVDLPLAGTTLVPAISGHVSPLAAL
eukprot:4615652-Alexandrium_andersonii.AAC.1